MCVCKSAFYKNEHREIWNKIAIEMKTHTERRERERERDDREQNSWCLNCIRNSCGAGKGQSCSHIHTIAYIYTLFCVPVYSNENVLCC